MKRHLADFPSEYGSSPRVDSYYGNVATVVTAASTTSSSSLIRSPHLLGGPRLDSFYSSTPKTAGSVAAGGTGSVVVQRGGSVVTSTPSQRNHNHHDHPYQNSQQNKDPSSKGDNSPNEGPLPSRHYYQQQHYHSVLTPLRSTSDAIASTTTEKELDFYRRRCEALLDVTLEYRQVIDNLQQQQKERLNETAAPPAVPESPLHASSSITPQLNDTKPSAAREPPRDSPLFLQWTSSLQQLSVECTTAKVELWCQTVVSHAASLPRQEQPSNVTKHAADDDVLAEDVGQQCAAILQTIDSVLPQ